jgi:hypothetical protein
MDTVEFFPCKFLMPITASKDMTNMAANELTRVLLYPAPASHAGTTGDSQLQALRQLSEIFSRGLQSRQNCPNHEIPVRSMAPISPAPVVQQYSSMVSTKSTPQAATHVTLPVGFPNPRVTQTNVPPLRVAPVPSPRVDDNEDENLFEVFDEELDPVPPLHYATQDSEQDGMSQSMSNIL